MSEFFGLWKHEKHTACTVGWVARICCIWLSPGKTTRISHRRNSQGAIQLLKNNDNKEKNVWNTISTIPTEKNDNKRTVGNTSAHSEQFPYPQQIAWSNWQSNSKDYSTDALYNYTVIEYALCRLWFFLIMSRDVPLPRSPTFRAVSIWCSKFLRMNVFGILNLSS